MRCSLEPSPPLHLSIPLRFYRDHSKLTALSSAFSQVVKDIRFSTIGVVLLAVLADVSKVVGLPPPDEQEQHAIAGMANATQNVHGNDATDMGLKKSASHDATAATFGGEDVGEVVKRGGGKTGSAKGRDASPGVLVQRDELQIAEDVTDFTKEKAFSQTTENTTTASSSTKKIKSTKNEDADVAEPAVAPPSKRQREKSTKSKSRDEDLEKRKKKRKQKKGDAIADLFSGLI